MSRPAVSITYCADCGYLPQATLLADALLREFGAELSSLSLIPWHEGTFDVMIDDRLVHSMTREGGFPEPAAIGAAVRTLIAARAVGRE